MSDRIERLKDAVELRSYCWAKHVESVPVIEKFDDKTVFEVVVEVFSLQGHYCAPRCYAWSFIGGTETRYVTVLERPPVDSPQTAVRAAIASGAQKSAAFFTVGPVE